MLCLHSEATPNGNVDGRCRIGIDYSTLSAAVAASQDGDAIQVQGGTYTDDFATITTNITIEGVGGMVNLVADEPPPNEKGILTIGTGSASPDVALQHFVLRCRDLRR